MPSPIKVELTLDYAGASPPFRWQMCFNRFTIDILPNGKLVDFAYVDGDQARDIVRIFISKEGLLHLKDSVAQYLPRLSGTQDPGPDVEDIPHAVRRFSPLFSNHVRMAHSGGTAEIAFYMITLSQIADEIRGQRKKGAPMPVLPVALLHSAISVHYRFICRVLDNVAP
jgi:hypothetical protein